MRLFTFGCSFTQWEWSTWADIVHRDNFTGFQNLGRCGAGNVYIFTQLMEAIQKKNINSDDTVMVMWSSVCREDRWYDGGWKCPGNIFTSKHFGLDFMQKYYDIDGFYNRDIPLMHAAQMILDSIGCRHHIMSMVDVVNHDQYETYDNSDQPYVKDLFETYESSLSRILPSVHNVIFDYDYNNRLIAGYDTREGIRICHPTPSEHLEYIEKVLPEYDISDQTRDVIAQEDAKVIEDLAGDWAGTRNRFYDVDPELMEIYGEKNVR